MDRSKVFGVSLSQDKALTAAVSMRGTHKYNELCKPGSLTFGVHTSTGGHFSIVGGFGCSSGTAEQDQECAQAGLDNFKTN